ncbi:MAG: hypothetical protein R3A78_04740 [Polyangiales bacterium]|nr:hypothetical protein [Myxococcales bacterium]
MEPGQDLFDVWLTGFDRTVSAPDETLARAFKVDVERARALCAQMPTVLRRGLDHAAAEHYRATLAAMGIVVTLRRAGRPAGSLAATASPAALPRTSPDAFVGGEHAGSAEAVPAAGDGAPPPTTKSTRRNGPALLALTAVLFVSVVGSCVGSAVLLMRSESALPVLPTAPTSPEGTPEALGEQLADAFVRNDVDAFMALTVTNAELLAVSQGIEMTRQVEQQGYLGNMKREDQLALRTAFASIRSASVLRGSSTRNIDVRAMLDRNGGWRVTLRAPARPDAVNARVVSFHGEFRIVEIGIGSPDGSLPTEPPSSATEPAELHVDPGPGADPIEDRGDDTAVPEHDPLPAEVAPGE